MLRKKDQYLTITASDMRVINRATILEYIRCAGPLSRPQIAQKLDISLPTVMRIVDGLIVEGWVNETGEKEWSGGRRRSLVRFNGSDHRIIGIDLGGTKIFGALVDFNGQILHEIYLDHHQTQAEESLRVVAHVLDELLKVAISNDMSVCGIGIGVPGVTDTDAGVVTFAPALGWVNFPLQALLENLYPVRIIIENDVNLAALGEVWFGPGLGTQKNLVLIAIGTGIGAGVVINGNIYTGAHYMAGEIGYLLLDRSHLGQSYPGFGAFELVASGTGIANRAMQMTPGEALGEGVKPITAEQVFAAARQHEKWAEAVLSDTIDYLAQAIAAIALLYDPDVVLLGGGVSGSADLLIGPILARINGSIPLVPSLQIARLGYRGAVMGATIKLLRCTTKL